MNCRTLQLSLPPKKAPPQLETCLPACCMYWKHFSPKKFTVGFSMLSLEVSGCVHEVVFGSPDVSNSCVSQSANSCVMCPLVSPCSWASGYPDVSSSCVSQSGNSLVFHFICLSSWLVVAGSPDVCLHLSPNSLAPLSG